MRSNEIKWGIYKNQVLVNIKKKFGKVAEPAFGGHLEWISDTRCRIVTPGWSEVIPVLDQSYCHTERQPGVALSYVILNYQALVRHLEETEVGKPIVVAARGARKCCAIPDEVLLKSPAFDQTTIWTTMRMAFAS